MAEQMAHLRQAAAAIRVLPFAAGAYPRRGSFALLDFADDEDPPVAYVEAPRAARYFDKPEDRATTSSSGRFCWRDRSRWRSGSDIHRGSKASASDDQGSCVEQRRNGDVIEVRDTKDPSGAGAALHPGRVHRVARRGVEGRVRPLLDR
jgi:hypothetical protein